MGRRLARAPLVEILLMVLTSTNPSISHKVSEMESGMVVHRPATESYCIRQLRFQIVSTTSCKRIPDASSKRLINVVLCRFIGQIHPDNICLEQLMILESSLK